MARPQLPFFNKIDHAGSKSPAMAMHFTIGRLSTNPRTHFGRVPQELAAAIADYAEVTIDAEIVANICTDIDVAQDCIDHYCAIIADQHDCTHILHLLVGANPIAYWRRALESQFSRHCGFQANRQYASLITCSKIHDLDFIAKVLKPYNLSISDVQKTASSHGWSSYQLMHALRYFPPTAELVKMFGN